MGKFRHFVSMKAIGCHFTIIGLFLTYLPYCYNLIVIRVIRKLRKEKNKVIEKPLPNHHPLIAVILLFCLIFSFLAPPFAQAAPGKSERAVQKKQKKLYLVPIVNIE
jgi:amino acid transporter